MVTGGGGSPDSGWNRVSLRSLVRVWGAEPDLTGTRRKKCVVWHSQDNPTQQQHQLEENGVGAAVPGCWWSNPGVYQLDLLDTTSREILQGEGEEGEGGEEEGGGKGDEARIQRRRMRTRHQDKEMGRLLEEAMNQDQIGRAHV